jgi:hypothetical protein
LRKCIFVTKNDRNELKKPVIDVQKCEELENNKINPQKCKHTHDSAAITKVAAVCGCGTPVIFLTLPCKVQSGAQSQMGWQV